MDDLLDKQSRELQDLGEATRAGPWAEGRWLGAKSDSPLDSTPSISSLPLSPGAHCGFYSCVFTHSLNTG